MTRTAAQVADGLLVMPFHSHTHVRRNTLPWIEEGLKGRETAGDLAIYPQAILAMGRTPEEQERADLGVRGLLAFYGSTPAYRPVLDAEGWGDLQPELNALSKTGAVMEMIDRVDERMLETLAVRGTPEDCAAEVHRRFGDLTDRVCAYFPGYDPGPAAIADLVTALKQR